jgi:hypothetical protein
MQTNQKVRMRGENRKVQTPTTTMDSSILDDHLAIAAPHPPTMAATGAATTTHNSYEKVAVGPAHPKRTNQM